MPFTEFDVHQPFIAQVIIENADSTGAKDFLSSGYFALRIAAIMATNDDTIDHFVGVCILKAFGSERIFSALVPARAGYDDVPAVDLMDSFRTLTPAELILPVSTDLNVMVDVEMTSSTSIWLTALGGSF